jgi:hypothetical protein
VRVLPALAVLAVASSAHAFCRETTVPVDPAYNQPTCWPQGLPVYWASSCVGYSLQKDASQQVSLDEAQQTMTAAFAQWTSASCTAPSSGNPSIDVRYLGEVSCHEAKYDPNGANANIVMFDDDAWPYPNAVGAETLALTRITYVVSTGELRDADIEVNTAQNTFSLDGTGSNPDLPSVLTHEAGHFLGLAHSFDPQATMYSRYVGTSMRDLAADDVAGICSIYAPDGTRATADGGLAASACDPTPHGGYATDCTGGCHCTLATRRGGRGGAAWTAVFALLLYRWRRRRPPLS